MKYLNRIELDSVTLRESAGKKGSAPEGANMQRGFVYLFWAAAIMLAACATHSEKADYKWQGTYFKSADGYGIFGKPNPYRLDIDYSPNYASLNRCIEWGSLKMKANGG